MLSEIQSQIIDRLRQHVITAMPEDPTGHDWPHIFRVEKNALLISEKERGDQFIIHLVALTHDLFDHKFFPGTEEEAKIELRKLLQTYEIENSIIDIVITNVFSLSYKNGQNKSTSLTIEGKIVQDADRIEAIGAIGIARAFAYGGFKKRIIAPTNSEFEIRNSKLTETTFGHFFEKLLLLYDLLNTETAKKIAKDKFDFMTEFVKRFGEEWGENK